MAATCRVPPSNLASQSLTGLALAVARRRMRVTLAPLGHDQAEAMITDESSFEYYDAILTRLMPVGGPRLGSTEVRLAGSFNPNPNPDPNPNPTPSPNPNPNPDPNPNQGWQERTDAALTHLLRSGLSKTGREGGAATQVRRRLRLRLRLRRRLRVRVEVRFS